MVSVYSRFRQYLSKNTGRLVDALFIGILSGLLSILIDTDHIICGLAHHSPFNLWQGELGCRLYHGYIPSTTGAVIGIIIALHFGLWIYIVGNSIKPKSKFKVDYGNEDYTSPPGRVNTDG